MSIGMIAQAQFTTKQVYTNPDLKKAMKDYKVIAILPVGTQLIFKSQVPYLNERNQASERINTGLANQSRIYSYLLPRSNRMKVEIQDIEKTNLLLLKSEMSARPDQYTKEEIAKILGVDAVLSGFYESDAFLTEEQVARDSTSRRIPRIFTSVKNVLTLTLYDGQTGKQMWRYYDYQTQSSYISDDLIEGAVRNLPFIQ
jgi:hypothetical protein